MTGLDLSRLRVLIIDDNPFSRRIAMFALRALNVHQIAEAGSALDGMSAMKSFLPDLVLVDWVMQPVDGIQFVKQIRADTKLGLRFIPLILVTAFSEEWRVREGRDAGANEFVVKPFAAKTLYNKIRGVIENPRSFIEVEGSYFGPDRRRRNMPFQGEERRRPLRTQDRGQTDSGKALQQEDIDKLLDQG